MLVPGRVRKGDTFARLNRGPRICAPWSVKDHLAHLALWDDVRASE
jgi:hypothetical protein